MDEVTKRYCVARSRVDETPSKYSSWADFLISTEPAEQRPPKSNFSVTNYHISQTEIFAGRDGQVPVPPRFSVTPYRLKEASNFVQSRAQTVQLSLNDIEESVEERLEEFLEGVKKLRSKLSRGDHNAAIDFINLLDRLSYLPRFLRKDHQTTYSADSSMLLIEAEFPNLTKHRIEVGSTAKGAPKYLAERATKKAIAAILHSTILRFAAIAAAAAQQGKINQVAVNLYSSWRDPATGTLQTGVIASLVSKADDIASIDLAHVDPTESFKHLKGLATPNVCVPAKIRPIFELSRDDDRIIAGRDVASSLDDHTNLACMDWQDFESLVAQLFEHEFAVNGGEVKVTRASRDRGVDAIAFDPDPFRGGKFVLQAKRYTRTVDVSAVRDLYGSLLNEGANRGILITTASFGPDAYEFAKDKPLSLVDGNNLLRLLEKHHFRYRIDLDEARRIERLA